MMNNICPKCGAPLNSNDILCPKCGYTINHTSNATISNKENKMFSGNNNPVFVFNNSHKSKPKFKFSQGLIIGTIVGIVVGAISGGTIAYSFLQTQTIFNIADNNTKSNNIDTTTDIPTTDKADSTNDTISNNNIPSDTTSANTPSTPQTTTTNNLENVVLEHLGLDDSEIKGAYRNGFYKCGIDLEPGEYVYLGSIGSAFITIYEDASKTKPKASLYSGIGKITLEENDFIDIPSTLDLLIPYASFDTNNLNKYGIYVCGQDIAPGEYKIHSVPYNYRTTYDSHSTWTSDSGYIEIYNNLYDNVPLQNLYINDSSYLTLSEGQLLFLRGAALTASN